MVESLKMFKLLGRNYAPRALGTRMSPLPALDVSKFLKKINE